MRSEGTMRVPAGRPWHAGRRAGRSRCGHGGRSPADRRTCPDPPGAASPQAPLWGYSGGVGAKSPPLFPVPPPRALAVSRQPSS